MDEIKLVHQSCRDCVFAHYSGDTQDRCELGLVDKYREFGELVEARDEDRGFYVVNRKCRGFRPNDSLWSRKYKGHEAQQQALESSAPLSVLVLLGDSLSGVVDTLESIPQGAPYEVFLMNRHLKPGEVAALAWPILSNRVTWRMVEVLDGDELDMIDWGVHEAHGEYYVALRPPEKLPANLAFQLDWAVNKDLKRWALVNDNCVRTAVHKALLGNKIVPFELNEDGSVKSTVRDIRDKIRNYAKQAERPDLIGELSV